MTYRSEDLLSAMSFIGEDLIQEAEQTRKRSRRPWAAGLIAAAALALVILALPQPEPTAVLDEPITEQDDIQQTELQINWMENASNTEADMDLLTEMRYEAAIDAYRWEEWSPAPLRGDPPLIHLPNQPVTDGLTVPAQFAQAAGVNGDEFYPALQERFTIDSYYVLWVRSSRESETYDLAHDHCLELQTGSGGTATLSVSREGWPLRCCLLLDEDPLLSTVQGVEMVIHGMKLPDRTAFFTRFEHDGVWYDIETEGISEEELYHLLETLICCRDSEADAVYTNSTTQDVDVNGDPAANEE